MTDDECARWARTLTTVGWLFVFAYLAFATSVIRRAFALSEGSFEDGLWGQRIEIISFLALPQNLMLLVPAAAGAAIGTVLARDRLDTVEMWLAQLVRIIAGVAYVVVVVAIIGILAIFFRGPDAVGDYGAIVGRLGGVLISIAIVRVCLEAEHHGARAS